MRNFTRGILAGTIIGALAGYIMKPKRKPMLKGLMDMAEDSKMVKRTGRMVRGMTKSMDKIMK